MNVKGFQLEINEAENQFEFAINGKKALIEYAVDGNKIYLTHTEVPPEFEGHGIASELVWQTLEHIKTQNLTVMPLCSFVARFIDNHPEWHALLSEGYQM